MSGQSLTRLPLPTQFIISGSLSVAAEKNHTSCLVSLIRGPRDGVGRWQDSTPLGPQIYSLIQLLQQAFPGGLLNARSRPAPRQPRQPYAQERTSRDTPAKYTTGQGVRVCRRSAHGHSENRKMREALLEEAALTLGPGEREGWRNAEGKARACNRGRGQGCRGNRAVRGSTGPGPRSGKGSGKKSDGEKC